MAMQKIKKNDLVIVLAGKDKGKQGVVLSVNPAEERVLVEGINMMIKHVRANPNAGQEGGRIKREKTLHWSNVGIVNPKTGKASRVGIRTEGDRKVRFFKSDNELVDEK